MPFQLIDPPSMSDPKSYMHSHVCTIPPGSCLVYTAGQIGMDKDNNIPENDKEQVALALKNLRTCLEASGATARDIVKLTIYVVCENPIAHPSAPLLAEFLDGHRPVSVCIPLPSLSTPGIRFEIEAIAAVHNGPPEQSSLPQSVCTRTTDVVVVGAGLSGLQAAHDIQKSGRSCIILEARDRIGGKTHSISQAHGRGIIEAGAAWINDTNQSEVSSLDLVVQNTVGDSILHDPGSTSHRFPNGQLPQVRTTEYAIQETLTNKTHV